MKRGHVLLADDRDVTLGGARRLLQTMFDTVMMVSDPHSLLYAAEKVRPDMAIVDLSISSSEEADLVRRLQALPSPPRVIVLSDHEEPSQVDELLAAGAQGLVLKCSAPTGLLLALREVLLGHRYVSPALREQLCETEGEETKKAAS